MPNKISQTVCPNCHEHVHFGSIQERYSFGVYAGRFCDACCGKFRDNCGLDGAQGDWRDLDEPYWEED